MDTRDPKASAADAHAVGRDYRDERRPADWGAADARPTAERTTARDSDGRSIGELLKELRDETSTLVRQELALAKAEMSEKAAKAARNAAYAGAGAVLAYLGLLFGLLAASVGLALLLASWGLEWHAWWLGPLIVGAVVGVVGCAMAAKGVHTLKQQSPVPEKTVQSLKEDKQWLQDKATTR